MDPDKNKNKLLALEKALRESESRFTALESITADSVIMVDESQNIIFFNKGAENIFGYPSSEVIGRPLGLLIPDRFAHTHREHVQVFEADPTPSRSMKKRNTDILGRRKDGSEFPAEVSISKSKKDGKMVFAAILRDITNQKLAEENRKAEYAFRIAIEESLTSGICAADIHGKMIYANPAFCEMVGWSEEELLGTLMPHFFWPPEETENIMNTFKRSLNNVGPRVSEELIFRRKNEERFPVLVLPSLLRDGSGNIIGSLGSFIDISEKKKMEEELGKVEKLKSLELLAGGIAHDFNNILTAILGNLSLAMMELDPNLTASQYLNETEKATLKAKNLASQLLAYTKGGTLQKKITSISHLIEDSTTFVLRGSHFSSEFHLPDYLWRVEVDPDQITQVIHNLVINAQQAMAEGGRIVISADNVMVDELSAKNLLLNPGPFVLISFKDNGKGIPQDLINKIFDPFFTTKEKGSGLGLFSAYSIVKNHNGVIKVESQVGVGTTFCVYLPALIDTEGKDDQKTEAILFGSGKILLMDDDELVRKMAGAMIQTLGYKVEVATKGEEALEMYRKAKEINQPFQAVILDLTIPGGKGGKQTIQELLAYDPTARVIVSSGYATDPIMANYQEYGFRGCVAKPYRIQDLSKALNDLFKIE